MLHASVTDELASSRERLRVLRAALPPAGKKRLNSAITLHAQSLRLRDRRSIRDQRQPAMAESRQRLVWVAGEAVCAIPEVAAVWPKEALAPPFYGCKPGAFAVTTPNGREGLLIRGRQTARLARLLARLRGRSWRSAGVTLGRLLFHLQRYGIAAPRLLAFGQRFTSRVSAEWFVLHTLPPEPLTELRDATTAEEVGRLLRRLHDAGCLTRGEPLTVFGRDPAGVSIRDITRITLVKRLTIAERLRDCWRLREAIEPRWWPALLTGYQTDPFASPPCHGFAVPRPAAELVCG
jgi:hypothetical protein